MAEENKQDWRVYVIPDMRTWAFPSEYEKQSKIEYFNSFDEAKKRFDELRKEPYNSEHALGYDGKPLLGLLWEYSVELPPLIFFTSVREKMFSLMILHEAPFLWTTACYP